MSAFLIWVRLVPKWVWALLLIVSMAGGLYLVGYSKGKASEQVKTAKVQAEFDAYKKEVKKAVAIRLTQNALKEAEDRKVFAEIAKQYKEDIANAKAKGDRVAADLRAGNIKLRKQWQGCSNPAKAADGSGGIDENTRLREESAGRIIGNAAQADSWIKALQDAIRQQQKPPAQ